jgi:dipeptidase
VLSVRGVCDQLVADAEEVFIFHVLPDDTGASAIWVAARVPDDEIAVVPNVFVVREVNLTDSANFLGSENMLSIALKHGFWNGAGLLDFTAAFRLAAVASCCRMPLIAVAAQHVTSVVVVTQ